jgi:hypothetical protein
VDEVSEARVAPRDEETNLSLLRQRPDRSCPLIGPAEEKKFRAVLKLKGTPGTRQLRANNVCLAPVCFTLASTNTSTEPSQTC